MLLGLDVLLVRHQVLIQVECIHLVHSCFVSEHFRWLIHFIRLSFAQGFSLIHIQIRHFANMALVNIIIIQ